ncbi:hypothetical protein [Lapidilactobacillus wuchangensis]|uniref:hypothetical protein n=1 Tax=Lapidilactobacillus wuchangensis TaxID=2486001 RepID=UPI000F77F6F4|nr:hypothetical protein [Lapidilactobacillus wuchangensis]
MREQDLMTEFLRIGKTFNRDLRTMPTLYGSLGLWKISDVTFDADDIDILVPKPFLKSGWKELIEAMKSLNYELKDEHEHKFSNGQYEVGISFVEDLDDYAGLDYRQMACVNEDGCIYFQLNLDDYQKVYSHSLTDSYRQENKGAGDTAKLAVISDLMLASPNRPMHY